MYKKPDTLVTLEVSHPDISRVVKLEQQPNIAYISVTEDTFHNDRADIFVN